MLRVQPVVLVALVFALFLPARAAAQGGQFVTVAPMSAARSLHTATPLADGRVLVVAGSDWFASFVGLTSAEIFDPVTRTWSSTGSLNHPRRDHQAVRLSDGRVLVAGGAQYNYPSSVPIDSAEVWNPVTGLFTLVGPMSMPRESFAVTRLPNGRVLVTGGDVDTSHFITRTDSAELFDPATGTFLATGAMHAARANHTATLLPNGTVLIVGGDAATQSTAEIYDPHTGTFTLLAASPGNNRRSHAATLLSSGRVLISGGTSDAATRLTIYDPSAFTFTDLAPSPLALGFRQIAVPITRDRVLFSQDNLSAIYDPATGLTTASASAAVGLLFPVGAPLPDGTALVTGGETFVPFTFVSTAAAQVFEPNDAPTAIAGEARTVSPGAGCEARVTLDGTASSDADGHALSFTWRLNDVVVGTGALVTIPLGLGSHTFTLTVEDGHGGADSDTVTITVVDTTAPGFAVPAPVVLAQAGPGGTVYTPAIPAVADQCDPTPTLSVSGVPDGNLFPPGTTQLTYTATDASGNTASAITTVQVVDMDAPVLTLPANIVVEAMGPTGVAVTFTATAEDALAGVVPVTCVPASGSTFGLGPTTVSCSATDGQGNQATGTFRITVVDTTPPALMLPGDLQVEAASPSGAAVAFAATAIDVVSGMVPVACVPAPGTVFPVGATLVSCSAVDAAGLGVAGSFTVTVTPVPRAPVAVALVNRLASLNGTITGSIRVRGIDHITVNGNGAITADLLVRGTPEIKLNGKPHLGAIVDGDGDAAATGQKITLNGNASVGQLVRRTDPAPMPAVDGPQAPTGTVDVVIEPRRPLVHDWPAVRDIRVQGRVDPVAIPAGAYRHLTVNGGNTVVLGTPGATEPSVYHFDKILLNGRARLEVAGPVVVIVGDTVHVDGAMGNATHPEWLQLRIANGHFTVNGNVEVWGYVTAPKGKATINGGSALTGGLTADQLIMNGDAQLTLVPAVLPPW